ncbi:hypothetical protein TDB9533_00782 [Thalassocella blandensis]|nr:hypothetical protein TDB9533_00782 [Thalassocella blandensis]
MKKIKVSILTVLLAGCGGESTNESPEEFAKKGVVENEWVFISDSSVQCGYEGESPEETQKLLLEAGIDVLESTCGHRTEAVPAVCGGVTTQINLHSIRTENVIDANNLGFTSVSDLENSIDDGYLIVDC